MIDEKKVEVKADVAENQDTLEPQDKTTVDERTLKTESGKEIKLNFIDTGDHKKENEEALESGVELQPAKTLEQIVEAKLADVDRCLNQFAGMMGQANMEVSGLITALLVRGLITHKELQHGMELVQKKMKEETDKAEAANNPEIIRMKPSGHGDNGIIEGAKQ